MSRVQLINGPRSGVEVDVETRVFVTKQGSEEVDVYRLPPIAHYVETVKRSDIEGKDR